MIEARDISRVFAGPPEVSALRDCSLTVGRGDYVAITGASGSGKSTLMHILGLLDRPTTGSVNIAGQAVEQLAERQRAAIRGRTIGFVFQAFHLIGGRTSLGNVELGQLYTGTRAAERTRGARAALERVGLGHRIMASADVLSGGERQRVAVARALVGNPSVLLCDEPTGNLDSVTTEKLLDLLDALNRDGLTLVVVTHDDAIAARARRVCVMRDGILL